MQTTSQIPRSKAIIFRVVMAVLMASVAAGLLEMGSLLVYRLIFGKALSRAEIQSRLVVTQASPEETPKQVTGENPFIRSHILHPYLGFVANPGTYVEDWEFSRNGAVITINEQGFPGPSPLMKRQKNSVNICILGGSFAMNFYLDSRDTLEAELKKHDFFRNKAVHTTVLAMSGWKQPQQLLGLSYMLVQGAEFDVVVNLDGFNEVALPAAENVPAQVYSLYPRSWPAYASRSMLPDPVLVKLSELAKLRLEARQRKRFYASALLRHSNFCLLLFDVLSRRAENRIRREEAMLAQLMNQETQRRTPEVAGPTESFRDEDEFFQRMADFWSQSSAQMSQLCRANGTVYLHFLQPNQYVPGSKPMGPAERQVALVEGDNSFKSAVSKGYPFLVRNGAKLREAGVDFEDLTMIFKDVAEPLYEDTCCHVNKRGNDMIAAEIATKIITDYPARLHPQ